MAKSTLTDSNAGNHDTRPMKEDGSRDLDTARSHVQTYRDMEKLLATGKVKAIGVANYSAGYLKELLANCSVVPAVCQIELHPRLPQEDLVEFCRQHGIHNTAYSPLGSSGAPLILDPIVQTLATEKGVPTGNILLNYHCVFHLCSVVRIYRQEADILYYLPSGTWMLCPAQVG